MNEETKSNSNHIKNHGEPNSDSLKKVDNFINISIEVVLVFTTLINHIIF